MTISHLADPTLKTKMALATAEKNLMDYAPSGYAVSQIARKELAKAIMSGATPSDAAESVQAKLGMVNPRAAFARTSAVPKPTT